MNKKPILLRWILAVIVIASFCFSMYPLAQRDFYETFQSLLRNSADADAAALVADAKKEQELDPGKYASTVLLDLANERGIRLADLVNVPKDVHNNRDVVSYVRKESSSSIRLGLDLNGGVEFMLELVPNQEFMDKFSGNDKEDLAEMMTEEFNRYRDQAIEILRKRLEGQSIFEAEIVPSGDRYIALRVPVVAKDEMLKIMDLIKMSAKLRFHLVHPENDQLLAKMAQDPANFRLPADAVLKYTVPVPDKDGKPVSEPMILKKRWEMDGKNVVSAYPGTDQFGRIEIRLTFDRAGAKRFNEVTSANINRRLAIVLDDKLYTAPTIQDAIPGGQAQITGDFSREEAKNISDALTSGAMPFQINVEAVFITDPTLGKDNVDNGIYAGIISFILMAVFICGYYLRAGFVAMIALGINALLVLGMMSSFGATLTLPGIAGIILTIGMATDANVLIFERIREELEGGKQLGNAIDLGFTKAFSAVLDANVTTFIIAVVLMFFGTGAVKGFAITLAIGIVTTMFTALYMTRLMLDTMDRVWHAGAMKMLAFFAHPNINFVGKRKLAFFLSGFMILGSVVLCSIKGSAIFGVDFTGGAMISFNYSERVPQTELTKVLKNMGFDARVAYKESAAAADNRTLEIMIRENEKINQIFAESSPKEVIGKALNDAFPEAKFTGGQESSVGGLVGLEFTKSAVLAVALSFLMIIVYISFRYELGYALAAVVALLHDVIVALGIYVLCGREVTLSVVAALLTIIGYSINATVVIFDRVREQLQLVHDKSYAEVVNLAINQTLSRTILSSGTTLLVLIVMFIWGGIAINDFVLVMLLGVIIGTYSSIYVASSLAIVWHKRKTAADKVTAQAKQVEKTEQVSAE